MKKKSLIFLIISVFLLLVSCTERSTSITVFSGGETAYTIITAEGASDDAMSLANALAELSGAAPEILTDASAETSHEIIIGDTSRAATLGLVPKLQAVSTVSAFHFIVAESDGKLVILSDAEIGYIYALDYIKETYITDGTLTIPRGTYDLKEVIWDTYYASDLYLERLYAAADKNRYDADQGLLNDEMNRYDDNSSSGVMTIEDAIEEYKTLLASFDTADFGSYTSTIFSSVTKYSDPTVYPSGTHPSILFTSSTIDTLRKNITASESAKAYNKYIALSDVPCDGKFSPITGSMTQNYDSDLTAKIEAKAFRFIIERDAEKYPNADDDPASIYGYEALYAIKNAMLTIDVPRTVSDSCRTYGHLMYVMACVYDWCYELMTDLDKQQLVAGGVNLLGAEQEVVYQVNSANKVPTGQGTLYGHGAEDQILVDYLSFAIACYNEAPEIYQVVGGRVLNDYVAAQNYLFQSGSPWEGSMYGSVRTVATMVANLLINRMTDGEVTPFENVEEAVVTTSYYIRPDGQLYRIGDLNENRTTLQFVWFANNCFYAGNLYGNSYLKSYAYTYLRNFNYFSNMVAGLSVIQFLAVNDPTVSHVYTGTAPLVRTTSYPNTALFAKSANNSSSAFGIYMTMPETYSASHAHAECGSFQIYYKGALATDSGAYDSWGGTHHMGYNMQTISSNSLLIYNPAFKDYVNSSRKNMIYSGGQSQDNCSMPSTYEKLLAHPALGQCTSLGVANVEENGVYLYSYMGGDMTNAYDEETVDEVCRYMFAVATGDANCPYVFMTFDRITSDDASFHKSALIHVQQEPTVLGDYYLLSDSTDGELKFVDTDVTGNYAIITNGEGRLVVQSVEYGTEFTVIGGDGYQYWLPGVDENGNYSIEDGKNLPTANKLVSGSLAEYGWGRLEISPAEASETNYMLTVMYVTDATNDSLTEAKSICSDTLAGAAILGKAVLFPKNEKLLANEASFTLTAGADCYITGVSAGTWNVIKNGVTVASVEVVSGTNLITFTADSSGTYTIKPAN